MAKCGRKDDMTESPQGLFVSLWQKNFLGGKRRRKLKKRSYEIDMCNGSIMDKLISFALPLMLSGILQLMFNAVDIIVVGRFSGSGALAAVGSTTALINVFTNLFMGISLGANVLAARCYAAGKKKKCQIRYIRRFCLR